jgi:hypothetical protein
MMNLKYPRCFPKAEDIRVYVNGQAIEVLKTNVAYFAPVVYSGGVKVEVVADKKIGSVLVSPLRLDIKSEVEDNRITFKLEENLHLFIQMEGIKLPLFFYGNRRPDYGTDIEPTYYFKAGQIYEVGELLLKDNDVIYIEGGAVVKGCIRARNASNLKIYGQGVLDGSYFKDERGRRRTIFLDKCTNIEIRDIIIIEPPTWMIMLAGCKKVHIDGIKEIGEVIGSDGVDIVGSTNVLMENCILRNNDDCVVIKSVDRTYPETGEPCGWNNDVREVLVRKCTFINAQGGNAIEIGHELQTDEVSNIKFYDIDIVSVHGHGAALSIHAGDRATVKDIIFENIRVEHYYDKLIDFRVMCSKWNKDKERGQIRNILVKDIYVKEADYNPGYTISVIGGYDSEHTVEDVTFENFYLNDRKIMNATQLDLFTRDAKNITFK